MIKIASVLEFEAGKQMSFDYTRPIQSENPCSLLPQKRQVFDGFYVLSILGCKHAILWRPNLICIRKFVQVYARDQMWCSLVLFAKSDVHILEFPSSGPFATETALRGMF